MLEAPLLIINLKAYPQAVGQAALDLGRAIQDAVAGHEAHVGLCPASPDIALLSRELDLPILAQHVDAAAGAATGRVPVQSAVDAGALGALVNHAERQLTLPEIQANLEALREAGLVSILCTANEHDTRALAQLGPDHLAVEPPELIGGDVSVTTVDPGVVQRSVEAAGDVPLLCGAGVKTGKDCATAVQLGAKGVLVASGVVKAGDPGAAAKDLLDGLLQG